MLHRPQTSQYDRRRDDAGFSLLELVLTVTLVATLTAIAVGVTPNIVKMAKGESGAQVLDAFLKRHREMAIARRRDIEIRFIAPNIVESAERAVPPAVGTTVIERMTFEGRIEYWKPTTIADTPETFGNANAIQLSAQAPVMFSSEGSFVDSGSNPVNATLSLAVKDDVQTLAAVTILGTTAKVQRWRWTGGNWVR
jgi:prepilin-type N-terminal cleavage/methylation domain-containing protein